MHLLYKFESRFACSPLALGLAIYQRFGKHDIRVYNCKNLYQVHIGYTTKAYIDVIMKSEVQLPPNRALRIDAQSRFRVFLL